MKRILFLLLAVSLSACAALPAVENAPEPARVIQPTPTVAFTPIPTFTVIPPTDAPTEVIPTLAPPTELPAGPASEIRFAANGTYVDVTDSIPTGASKTYSVNAMQGQVMSVSVLPQVSDGNWGYIPMQIKGADGTVLCPTIDNPQCMFWRGMLPASQNYFVTLAPDIDISQFVMRVAINPLNMGFQYFDFKSQTGLSLTYPDTFAPALPVLGNYKTEPVLTLQLIESELYEKTNLSEVYLMFSSSTDSKVVSTCTEPNQNGGGGPENPAGEEVVNGLTFVHTTTEGAGAGNYYQQEIFRTVYNNACNEVIFYIHYTNVGNYTPGTVTEFNRDAVMQNLEAVLSMVKVQ
ncbi:MAG: hypothetical protein HY865_23490 [Chloroflexi bacterium]|nr:hypothetical protein [Chloroflexota bacterium]